jgi:hypothetical protein
VTLKIVTYMILHSTSDYSLNNSQKQIPQQNSTDGGQDNSSDLANEILKNYLQ